MGVFTIPREYPAEFGDAVARIVIAHRRVGVPEVVAVDTSDCWADENEWVTAVSEMFHSHQVAGEDLWHDVLRSDVGVRLLLSLDVCPCYVSWSRQV